MTESLYQQLCSQHINDRDAALEALRSWKNNHPEAVKIVPSLIKAFGLEKRVHQRQEIAFFIVRFSPHSENVSDLIEMLTQRLVRAKNRNDKFAAFVGLRLAAEKGWAIQPAAFSLLNELSGEWGDKALEVLIATAKHGEDVMLLTDEKGMPLWELLELLLDFKKQKFDTRLRILSLVLAAGEHRLKHLSYFRAEIEDASRDTTLPIDLTVQAKRCLTRF